MTKNLLAIAVCLAVLVVHASRAPAQASDGKAAAKTEPKLDESKETFVETKRSIALAGKKLDYTASAGTIFLKNDKGVHTANVFYVAYTKDGVSDFADRPVTFAFNGGPGSSAVWLHLGALGPRRLDVGEMGDDVVPPYKMVDNDTTILDVTDLVFIDPVSTGYSRPAPGQDGKPFHSVSGDVKSVADFIRLYVTRCKRWNSPKYLAGESYGTTRASGLASYLQDEFGMYLNGILLVSPALDFQTILFGPGNDLPYILYLPSYAATAWYHKRLAPELQADREKTLAEARKFAQGEYAHALFRGNSLSRQERHNLAKRISHYTALPEEFVLQKKLRIALPDFMAELLRKDGQIVGRFDSRLKAPYSEEQQGHLTTDPSYASVLGPFAAAFNRYIRDELRYSTELPYEILNIRLNWDFDDAKNSYTNVSDSLSRAMTVNRNLKVFVATGYYDMATTFTGSEYTLNHLDLTPELRGHVALHYYDAGHMMYVHPASRHRLKDDMAKFYEATRGARK